MTGRGLLGLPYSVPRLKEFKNGKMYATDLKIIRFKFLDVIGDTETMNLAHITQCSWVDMFDKEYNNGDVISEINRICGKGHVFLKFYVNDWSWNLGRKVVLKKTLTYCLSYLCDLPDRRNRIHQTYELFCLDDVSSFTNLEKFYEVEKEKEKGYTEYMEEVKLMKDK